MKKIFFLLSAILVPGLSAIGQTPPAISGLSMSAGIPGSSVTITGTGFNATTGNNIVYFGATRGTVTAASTTSLTVTVPTGTTYKLVSVMNGVTKLTGVSKNPFLSYFNNSAYLPGAINFDTRVKFTGSIAPYTSIAIPVIADMDGDGKPDLVSCSGNKVTVFRNTGTAGTINTSSFAPMVQYTLPGFAYAVNVGDLNGDSKPDIVVTRENGLSLLRNVSTPGAITTVSFATAINYTMDTYRDISISDMDSDGMPEIVLFGAFGMRVMKNITPGGSASLSFTLGTAFATGTSGSTDDFYRIASADLDGDGKNDVVVLSGLEAGVRVFRNTSSTGVINSSSFASYVTLDTYFPAGAAVYGSALKIADIDMDGKPDIVANAHVFRNISSPGSITSSSFAARVDFSPVFGYYDVADVDGDGKPDIVSRQGNKIYISRNTCSPGVITSTSFTLRSLDVEFPWGVITAGDLDADGKADLVTTGESTIAVLKNNPSLIAGNTNTCVGVTSTLTPAFEGGTWSSSDPSVAQIGAISGFVAGLSPGTTIITYTYSGGSGTMVYSVDPLAAISGTLSMCTSGSTTLSPGIPGGTWSSGNTAIATVGSSSGIASGVTVGVDTITYTSPRGCRSIISASVNIPAATIVGTPNVCVGATVTVNNSVSSGTWSSSDPEVAAVSRGGYITGASAGTAVISYYTGCSVPVTKIATVNAMPASISGNRMINIGTTSTMSDPLPGGTWSSSNTAIATVGSVTGIVSGVSSGFATVTYSVAGCKATVDMVVNPTSVPTKPVVYFVSPNTAIPGTAVVITGTGFNTSAAADRVYFGAVQATVIAASSTSLTVTVPVGATYAPVSVTNTANSLTGYSPSAFMPTYDGFPYSISLTSNSFINTTVSPYRSIVKDMDGDGKSDIITLCSNKFIVYRNVGVVGVSTSPSFAPGVDFMTIGALNDLHVEDIDGDGKPEVITINNGDYTRFSIFHNASTTGTINSTSFVQQVDIPFGYASGAIATGDMNADGKPDIVVGYRSTSMDSSGFFVFENNISGTISFSAFTRRYVSIPLGWSIFPRNIAVADLNGDNKPDVSFNAGNGSLYACRNTTTSGVTTFAATATFGVSNDNSSLAVGDIDGDRKPEVVLAGVGGVQVLRNTSTATAINFAPALSVAGSSGSLALGDMDGNGKLDIVSSLWLYGENSIQVTRDTASAISSASAFTYSTVYGLTDARGLAVADMDGDKTPDLVVTSGGLHGVFILQNRVATPSITGMNPATGDPGSSVTIIGKNFSTGAGNNVVAFGSEPATITAATPTALSVTVPDAATFAPLIAYNANGVAGTSRLPFVPTYDNKFDRKDTLRFKPRVDIPTTGYSLRNTLFQDIDGDNKPDLIVATSNGSYCALSVFRNISTGTTISTSSFASPVNFPIGTFTESLLIRDMDGDGKPDILGHYYNGQVFIFKNKSVPGAFDSTSLETRIDWANSQCRYFAIDDMDGDGRLDIVAADFWQYADSWPPYIRLRILKNSSVKGTLSFALTYYEEFIDYLFGFAVSDIDGDGRKDIAYCGRDGITVMRNRSMMSGVVLFDPRFTLSAGRIFQSLKVGDMDGDGRQDLLVSSPTENLLGIVRNMTMPGTTSATDFGPYVYVDAGSIRSNLCIGDVNGDGHLDIAVGRNGGNELAVLLNKGSGTIAESSFGTAIPVASGSNITEAAISDINGDARPDIVFNNATAYVNQATIMINDPISDLFSTSMTQMCIGDSAILLDTIAGSSWSSSNVAVATISASGKIIAISGGTANITYTYPSGTDVHAVTVSAAPVAGSITGTSSVCAGASVALSVSGTGGTWSSSTLSVASVDTSGVLTGLVAGGTTISYTVANSCGSASATKMIVVDPMPAPGSIIGSSHITMGGVATLSQTLPGGTWSASNSNLSVSSAGVVSGLSIGTSIVSYTVSNSCGAASATKVMSVDPFGVIIGVYSVCPGAATTLSCAVTGGTWSSGNIAVATVGSSNGVVSGVSPGTATITYAITGANIVAVVTVAAAPSAGSITGLPSVAAGGTITLSDAVSGGVWSSGNITVATIGSGTGAVTGVLPGTVIISYAVSNGCFTSVATYTLTVASAFTTPPVITSVSPVNASSGSTITIAGSGFSATAVYNIVYIGGVKAAVTAASTSSLTVVVPVGASPSFISVTNELSNLTGYSPYLFVPSFDNSAYLTDTLNFETPVLTGAGNYNPLLALGDLNGDGKTDMLVYEGDHIPATPGSVVTVRLNQSTSGTINSSSFGSGVDYQVSVPFVYQPIKLDLADFDGDGKLDILTMSNTGDTEPMISVLRNTLPVGVTSSASFDTSVNIVLPPAPPGYDHYLLTSVVEDINSDGKPDILMVVNYTFVFLENTSSAGLISFAAPSYVSGVPVVYNSNAKMRIADIDGDGKRDVLLATGPSTLGNDILVYRNLSDSTSVSFATPAAFRIPDVSWSFTSSILDFVASDLDGDGKCDIAASCQDSSKIVILRNTATPGTINAGSFAPRVTFDSYTPELYYGMAAGWGLSAADLNGDGKPEIAYVTATGIAALRNTASPGAITGSSFSAQTLYYIPMGGSIDASPISPIPADIDGDGISDIVYGSNFGFGVMRNHPLLPVIDGDTVVCIGYSDTLTCGKPGGTWVSSNTAVATIGSDSGICTGVAAGTATITYFYAGHFVTKIINVTDPVAGTITGLSVVSMGETVTLSSAIPAGSWEVSNANASIIGTGELTGINVGTVIVSYIVSYPCATAIATMNVTVSVVSGISGSLEVCEGQTVTLANSTPGGTWSSNDTTHAVISASGVVTGVTAGTVIITYHVGSDIAARIVTVNASPDAGTISGTAMLCVGDTATLVNPVTGGAWTGGATGVASVNSSGIVSGIAGGTTVISYTVVNGCGIATTTRIVTVNTVPGAGSITGAPTVNVSGTTTLSNAVSGGTWSSSNTGIAAISSSGVVTGIAAGTAVISYSVSNSCGTAVAANTVTVNATTTIDIFGDPTLCVGTTTSLTASVPGGTWSSSTPAKATVSAAGVVTGVAAGTSVITYNVSGSIATVMVTVNAALPTIGGTGRACPGTTTTLSNTVIGGTWSSSNISIATANVSTGVITGVDAGTANVIYTAPTGCTRSIIVTINATPTIGGTLSACTGTTASVTSSPAASSWSSSATSVATISATGVVTAIAAGTTTISVTVATGCTASAVFTVGSVTPIDGVLTTCVGSTTSLSNATSGGNWSSSSTGIASVNTSGVVTGVNAGTSTISYTLAGGCRRTAVVTVSALPTITGTPVMCGGNSVALAGSPAGGTWSSANPAAATVSSTGVVTGVATGTTGIVYTAMTGCSRTIVATVSNTPGSFTGSTSICAGTTTTLTNSVTGGTWSSSNAGLASVGMSNGVVSGIGAGIVNITYKIGSCLATTPFTVMALPNAITGTAKACVGLTTTLSNTTTGGTWSSANPSIHTVDAAGVVTGVAAGTANIIYTATNTCTRSIVTTINAVPNVLTGARGVCVGAATTLASTTGGVLSWSSSNTAKATVSTAGVVTGIALGTSNITYTITSGCYTTAEVTVNAGPSAITGTTTACAGTATTLSSATAGGSWSSSNTGIAQIDTNGVVAGIVAGTATITYSMGGGCRVTTPVTVLAGASAISGASTLCTGMTMFPYLTAVGGGAWSSSNPTVATVPATHGAVFGVSAGTSTIVFTAANGCTSTKVVTVSDCPSRGMNSTGVEGVNATSISLYPNPTKGTFTINTPEAGVLDIYTIDGREVMTGQVGVSTSEFRLPTTLTTGIYMCRFTGNAGATLNVRLVFEAE